MWLAIDTARARGTVALGHHEGITYGDPVVLEPRQHAAGILAAVETVLANAGAKVDAVDGVVVGEGPGSFTGLRIAAAVAKALAHARPVRVAIGSSLLAAAWGSSVREGVVLALSNALRGELYAGLWRVDRGGIETLVPPRARSPATITTLTPAPNRIVGDGPGPALAAISAWAGVPVTPPADRGAVALIELLAVPGGVRVLAPGEIGTWEPEYGRPAEAQARWERIHGRPLADTPGRDR